MKRIKWMIAFLAVAMIVVVAAKTSNAVYADNQDDVICNGVFIDTVNISNMTAKEAEEAVDTYIQQLKKKKLSIDVDGNLVETTVGDLGYEVVPNDYIKQALEVGKSGNLIKRYKDLKDIEKDQLVFHLKFTLSDEALDTLVNEELTKYNIEAVNAALIKKNGKFTVTESKTGRQVVADETEQKIQNAILKDWDQNDIQLSAVVIDAIPKYTKEDLNNSQDLLGSFTTDYKSSSKERASNLSVGARKINGTMLYPGDVFSAYKALSPFTVKNGYFTAGAYENGKIVDSIGGGACQVSTTLYNAVLRAELEIVERAAHSMIVSYVEPAMDAAIAGTWKDLKFKNNTNSPIYIEAYTVGKSITFKIYGNETRSASRKIKFVSEIVKTIDPGKDIIEEDKTKPVTYKKVTQKAKKGYQAYLYKVIYENGVEVGREKVNFSKYNASPNYITVGTIEVPTEPEAPQLPPEQLPEQQPQPTPEVESGSPQASAPPAEESNGNEVINNEQ